MGEKPTAVEMRSRPRAHAGALGDSREKRPPSLSTGDGVHLDCAISLQAAVRGVRIGNPPIGGRPASDRAR